MTATEQELLDALREANLKLDNARVWLRELADDLKGVQADVLDMIENLS